MTAAPHRLHNRLMVAFAAFTLIVSAVFGLYAIVFMYAIEDAFFDGALEQEAVRQRAAYAADGAWTRPRDAWMTVYDDPSSFPADFRDAFAAEPWRTEFPGRDGRHYHVRTIAPSTSTRPAWLVAEVGAQLVVRPVRDRVLILLACTGVVLVALALFVGYRLARRTTGPLSRLADRIEGMAPDRLPRDFARDYADDEVGVLARGLEALVGRVDAFIAREQAFTRDASHELRTPLAVILGAAERLATEPQLSDAGRRHVGHVRHSVVQLEQTVTTLLTLAREEHAVADGTPTPVLPVLERVIVEQSPLLDGKGVDVDIDVPNDARVAVPEPVLHILLSNLVGNAFAHTVAGDVRVDVRGGRLRVANSAAAGEPAEHWKRRQPFSKSEGSSGFGLGFAIVQRLCDRYRIDLAIDDTGGHVVVSVPLAIGSAPNYFAS